MAAHAQPSFSESFYIAPGEGGDDEARAIDTCGRSFRQPLLQSGAFVERQTPEVAELVSECVGSTTSSSFARECDLATAQSQVDLIILFQATEIPGGWLFEGTAMSPLQAAAVWADDVLIEQEHAVLAGRDACSQLGHSFLVNRGIEAGPAPQASTGTPAATRDRGRLEIMDVTPSPVTVLIDGAEVGLGPGQFLDLPLGNVEVTLRATGYQDMSRSVELTADSMEALRGLSLDPLPAMLVVSCNVEGATIELGGSSIGTTRGGGSVELEVSPGRASLRVAREGYTTFEQRVELVPGGRLAVDAGLDVYVAPAAPAGFVLIEAGSFQMGSPTSEPGRDDDETQHRVTITRDFYLQAHEVTQGEWQALMGSNPSYFPACGDDCPVELVSWYEAVTFANELSESEGRQQCYNVSGRSGTLGGGCDGERYCTGDFAYSSVSFVGLDCDGYRLPTEAEWEYAARAGTTTTLYTGSMDIRGERNAPALDPIAWYGGNSGVTYSGGRDCSGWDERQYTSSSHCGTHPVGSKSPNDWGLYDVLGNVWEWTWDWYGDYPSGSVTDPTGVSSGQNRVIRGGSWNSYARYVRSANRSYYGPGRRRYGIGFRLARSAP